MESFLKDPSAVLDWTWDWSLWLASGETISSHTVTVPTGITKDSSTNSTTGVTAWLSGGTAGTNYTVSCTIVTSAARTDTRRIIVQVRNR